jgi:hypothetical protein
MAIEGPLRELALTDVFQLLDLSRKTGVLTITPEGGRERPATVRFERGSVVGAELGEAHERLGHLLLRAGKVTERQIEQIDRLKASSPEAPIGSLMVEHGIVGEAEVQRQLRFQIQEVVYDLIQWKDGYFRFEEGSPPAGAGVGVRVTTESLLMEAARRVDEWSTLETKVPHMGVIPVLVADSSEGATLDLHPSEWEVLAEIDGTRTLKTIAGTLGRSDFEVAKIVFGLVSTGVVEVREQPETPRPAAVMDRPLREALAQARASLASGGADRARRSLDDLSRAHPDRPEVWVLLAEAQRRLGRWGEAVISLGRAAALDPLAGTVHYQLGFAAVHTGDIARAREAWNTFLRLGDGVEPALRVRADRGRSALSALLEVLEEEGG